MPTTPKDSFIPAHTFSNSLPFSISLLTFDRGGGQVGSEWVPSGIWLGSKSKHFGDFDTKASFNVFTQNLWYLGNKIAPGARVLSLKRLIDFQLEFMRAFEDLIRRSTDQEAVMRDLAIRCLSSRICFFTASAASTLACCSKYRFRSSSWCTAIS